MRLLSRLSAFMPVFLAAIIMAGCADDNEDNYVERPVEEFYNEAMDAMRNEEFQAAATAFEEVERQHPYSVWATKAKLMAAYAHYEDQQYDDAVVAIDRFIQLHPGHQDIAYAHYIKALSYYEQITDVSRDQKMTALALSNLHEVVERFPDTKYARDARLKIDLARDHLAGKEMTVGRYYLNEKQYLAAINRFTNVVKNYETTTHVPEALYRICESYMALGLPTEARKVASVMSHNFPGDPWYEDAYRLVADGQLEPPEESEGWFSWDLGLSKLFD